MRRWRTMFSTSTIASSTRIPTTSESASSEITLTEKPSRYMPAKAGITDIGGGTRLGDGVADAGHLVEADAAAVGQRDLHVGQLAGRLHRGQRAHRLLAAAEVGAAARAFGLHQPQLTRDVGRGGAERLQLGRV